MKGFTSLGHYTLAYEFIPLRQAMKMLDAKAAVDKEWEKLEKLLAWQMTKNQEQKRGQSRGAERGKDSSLCHADGHMPAQKL